MYPNTETTAAVTRVPNLRTGTGTRTAIVDRDEARCLERYVALRSLAIATHEAALRSDALARLELVLRFQI